MPEEGKDLVRRWCEEVFNEKDLAVCNEIMADRYVEHAAAPFGRSAPGEVNGPEHTRGVAAWLFEQFPDLRMEIEALIAEGDEAFEEGDAYYVGPGHTGEVGLPGTEVVEFSPSDEYTQTMAVVAKNLQAMGS